MAHAYYPCPKYAPEVVKRLTPQLNNPNNCHLCCQCITICERAVSSASPMFRKFKKGTLGQSH